MRVTISFDETLCIVVPCGDGKITVRELINLATTRYTKASGNPNHLVLVSSLKMVTLEAYLIPMTSFAMLVMTGNI